MPLVAALMELAAIDLIAPWFWPCDLRLWCDVANTAVDFSTLEPRQMAALGKVSRSAERPIRQVDADTGILRLGRHDGHGLKPPRARRYLPCGCHRLAVTRFSSPLLPFAVSAPPAHRMVCRIRWTGHE
jgi:hypothetical protein